MFVTLQPTSWNLSGSFYFANVLLHFAFTCIECMYVSGYIYLIYIGRTSFRCRMLCMLFRFMDLSWSFVPVVSCSAFWCFLVYHSPIDSIFMRWLTLEITCSSGLLAYLLLRAVMVGLPELVSVLEAVKELTDKAIIHCIT